MNSAPPSLGRRLRARWPLLRKILVIGFALVVIGLLVDQARNVEWEKVLEAVEANTWPVLLRAAGITVLSYLIYSCFDLLAIPYLGHRIPPLRVMAVGIVAYAFNLNMGSLVGSVGFRFRLYLKLGLAAGEVTRIVGLSLTTNWLGYLWIAGGLFAWGELDLPDSWSVGSGALRLIGVAMIVAAAVYVGLCGWSRKRAFSVRGHEIELPSLRIALVQSVLGAACWASIGSVVWALMRHDVPYPLVLGILLLSGIAGAVTHIPGGLGVVEAVFIAMLGGKVPHYEILGTLLTYRAIYYLAPFVIAAILYFVLEAGIRKGGGSAAELSGPIGRLAKGLADKDGAGNEPRAREAPVKPQASRGKPAEARSDERRGSTQQA